MSKIVIYDAERDAGLSERIQAETLVSFAASLVNSPNVSESTKAKALKACGSNLGQPDLHYLETVLATVGWNNNDDVFSPEEIYAARHTPEDKPFNFEHDESDIIGHITGSNVIDDEGTVLADDLTAEKLPERFHIKTNAVLYKHWEDEVKAKRIEQIIKEIAADQWFVSMEALMNNFDYALIDVSTKAHKVVARNRETAFLTKHLRRYGGKGEYENFRVGRLLRGITFAGKGLVRRPANPQSIILKSEASFHGQVDDSFMETKVMSDTQVQELSKEIANLQKEIVKANSERDDANAKIATFNTKASEVEILSLKAAVVARDEQITALKASVDKAAADKKDGDEYMAAKKKEYEDAKAELLKLKAEAQTTARTSKLVASGHDPLEAAKHVTALAGLSDEQFDAIVVLAKKAAPVKDEDEEAKAAKAAKAKADDEEEEDDEAKAAKAALEKAKANADVNLGIGTQKVLAAKLAEELSGFIGKNFFKKSTAKQNKAAKETK